MNNEMVEIGKIVNTHGIKGELKVMPWADGPDFFEHIDYIILDGGKMHSILNARVVKNCALLRLSEIDTIVKAELIKNKTIFIYKKDLPKLPKGVFYIRDVIGLKVKTIDGEEIGTVTDIVQTGSNDVYEVKKSDGKLLYLPYIEQCIKEVNVKDGYVSVVIMEGLE